ncbi:hypothetical protein [Williamsia sterculiae]|uniref:Uncharacterized protein n=1 Tax=Williamsia sterculiae TaxID=1344003 RepID=A0A1N7H181_9NOCA|nr:hypothetical protein [Williamsia sterculiae]SIS18617.1 hypothetical protein SAMN05445060_3358 [Williamsia sterculiae]
MIVPVLIDEHRYRQGIAPQVGDDVRWQLFWNEPFAGWWPGLRPGWSLTAALRPAASEPVTHLGARPEDNTLMQPAIGTVGALRVHCTAQIPVPDTVVLSGAVRLKAGLRPRADTPQSHPLGRPGEVAYTEGVIAGMHLVSIKLDYRAHPQWPAWHRREPIAGSERIYDLDQPPAELHTHWPDGDTQGAVRVEELLVDLDLTGNR